MIKIKPTAIPTYPPKYKLGGLFRLTAYDEEYRIVCQTWQNNKWVYGITLEGGGPLINICEEDFVEVPEHKFSIGTYFPEHGVVKAVDFINGKYVYFINGAIYSEEELEKWNV